MFRLVVVLACVSAALAATSPLEERIIGGSNASEGQFPYQVSIRLNSNYQHNCGGTIISNRFIVTAAHCIYEHDVSDFFVVAGSIYISSGGIAFTLEKAIPHSNFDPKDMAHDIALLKTSRDMEFSSTIQPLPLFKEHTIPDDAIVVLSGWGRTSWSSGASPDTMQYINLHTINMNDCGIAHKPSSIFVTQICTDTAFGKCACTGDSGGPLVYEGSLAGVVSWGKPCATGYPDVYTRISSYVSWIEYTMKIM